MFIAQSTSSDEPPAKTNVSKPNSVTNKIAKTSTVPPSDCEAKVAARQKEMKGKVRSKKSVNVRMVCVRD